jgi:hypothetical protein
VTKGRIDGKGLATKPVLSIPGAAARLKVSYMTLYLALHTCDMPFPVFRINRRTWMPRRAIEELLCVETSKEDVSDGAARGTALSVAPVIRAESRRSHCRVGKPEGRRGSGPSASRPARR